MQSLAGWTLAEALPVTAEQVQTGIAIATALLRPADPREAAVKLDRTLRLWRLPEAWDDVAEFYLEALEDVPSDLLDVALKRVRLSHKYPTAPSPAEFRLAIASDLAARKAQMMLLRSAEFKARLEAKAMERRAVKPVDTGAAIEQAVKRMPTYPDERRRG